MLALRFTSALYALLLLAITASGQSDSQFVFAKDYNVGSAVAIAAGDFNGDGVQDLVVIGEEGSAQILIGNRGGGFKFGHKYSVNRRAVGVAVADLNGDGRLDLIAVGGSPGSGKVNVLFGNGDGTFKSKISYTVPGRGVFVAVGDFNGDGKPDLAVAYSGGLAILLNSGNGTFGKPISTKVFLSSFALGDFNGDGNLDMLFASQTDVQLLLGKGNGRFQDPFHITVGVVPLWVAAGDFNRDGKLDFVVSGSIDDYQYSAVAIALGNGDGTFQAGTVYPANGDGAAGPVAVADLNGDGKLDFAVESAGGSDDVGIFYGRGDGYFAPGVTYRTGQQPSGGLTVVGTPGSRAMDLVVFAGVSDISVLVGDGKGHFQAARDYLVGETLGSFDNSFEFGDLRGNGRMDVVVPGNSGVAVLLNAGKNTFRPAKYFGLPSAGVALGDFDGDGKLDMVSGAE